MFVKLYCTLLCNFLKHRPGPPEYNAYNVRKQKDRLCPPGVPEDNFHFPERQGIKH